MEVQGKIIKVLKLESGVSQSTDKEWKRQSFVIETFGDYPKKICLQCWNTMVDHLSNRKEGDTVECRFTVESREYNERWYTDVHCSKIELL